MNANSETVTIEPDGAGKSLLPGDSFFIQSEGKGKFVRIETHKIVFVESALNYVQIHVDGGSYVTYLTIKEMEETLPSEHFMRIHKSFIVNLNRVSAIEGNIIYLSNKMKIVLGPSYRKVFFNAIYPLLLKSKRHQALLK